MRAASRESPEFPDPPKRRRTVLACNECREKKRKCDGIKPICSACKRRDIPACVWDEERVNKVWNNRYIQSLKERIKELESKQQPISLREGDQSTISMSISPEESSPTHFGKGQECVQGITEPTQHPSHESPILSEKQHHLQESEDPGIYHDDLPIFDFNVPGGNCNFEQPINSQSTPPDDNEVTATENADDDVDAMGVISHFPNPINGRKRKLSNYFGPSSTKGLLDKAHGRCPSLSETCTTSPSQVRDSLTSHASPANTHGFKSNGGVFGMVIPSRAEADSLISSYWHWTHSLYPFIHRPSFEQRYLTVWYPHTQSYTTDKSRDSTTAEGIYANISDRLFYCMLNTVFSLGALFSSRINQEDRASVAYTFYERAKQLLDIDLLADGSLALVQTLLLMGQYLQSTDMSNSCWNIIGLAVRVAQCIGLHHDPQACDQGCCSTQSFEQVDIEMRRRAWTGCIMLDRVLSLTYGRPLMVHSTISQSHLMLPSAIDDEHLDLCSGKIGSQPVESPSLLECYIQAVQLQEILGHILTQLYYGTVSGKQEQIITDFPLNQTKEQVGNNRGGNTDLQQILKIDKILVAWHSKLPAHLKLENYEKNLEFVSADTHKQAIFYRQSTVLEMRFLHVRMMMLRPVLPVIGDPENNLQETVASLDTASFSSNIELSMLLKARTMCMNVAQKQLRIIESGMHYQECPLPPPWYTVFYIHSCALVLLTVLLWAPSRTGSTEETPISAFNRCLAALHAYESQSRTARQCSKSLIRIKQALSNNLHQKNLGRKKNNPADSVPIFTDDNAISANNEYLAFDSSLGNDDSLPEYDLLNDGNFYQYAWMPDVSLCSQNDFGDIMF